jgi:hypothetical protein
VASSRVVSLAVRSDPERPLLKMPHTDGSKMSSRREVSHRTWPPSLDNEFYTIAAVKA